MDRIFKNMSEGMKASEKQQEIQCLKDQDLQ